MTSEELQGVIERIEVEFRAARKAPTTTSESNAILTLLPRAAERYRRQIEKGLAGDELEATKARVFLRELFGGDIRLVPKRMAGLWRAGICTPPRCSGVSEQMVAGAGFAHSLTRLSATA